MVDSPMTADPVAWQFPTADCQNDGVDFYSEHQGDFRCGKDPQAYRRDGFL
jgi:hypothetical protein